MSVCVLLCAGELPITTYSHTPVGSLAELHSDRVASINNKSDMRASPVDPGL